MLILCLITLYSCGEDEACQLPECRLVDDGYFLLRSSDVESEESPRPYAYDLSLDATLIETPLSGPSGHFLLRDNEGNEYRLEPVQGYETAFEIQWDKQLNDLQLGESYHFVFSKHGRTYITGMKVFHEGTLLYLAASYSEPNLDFMPFRRSGLEGFTATQHDTTRQDSEKQEGIAGDEGHIAWIATLPVTFTYDDQSITLDQTEEVVFTTPGGQYLVHLLYSAVIQPFNYDDGGAHHSFYIKRL